MTKLLPNHAGALRQRVYNLAAGQLLVIWFISLLALFGLTVLALSLPKWADADRAGYLAFLDKLRHDGDQEAAEAERYADSAATWEAPLIERNLPRERWAATFAGSMAASFRRLEESRRKISDLHYQLFSTQASTGFRRLERRIANRRLEQKASWVLIAILLASVAGVSWVWFDVHRGRGQAAA